MSHINILELPTGCPLAASYKEHIAQKATHPRPALSVFVFQTRRMVIANIKQGL